MISFSSRGSFLHTDRFLKAMQRLSIPSVMNRIGSDGVQALAKVTPKESSLTANSWNYKVTRKGQVYEIVWTNSDIENGFPVAIMLQYGYGTGTGGYVRGRDYINPAIRPIFDRIDVEVWKAVTSA